MNSHFQSSEMASITTGFLSDSSGRYGSSACEERQVSTASTSTIMHGIDHTTTSIAVECDHFGS
ncbi:hypothetical protein D3C72_2034600 [compost metagenome]